MMVHQTDQIEDILQMVRYSYGTTSIHQLYSVPFFVVIIVTGSGWLDVVTLHHSCKIKGEGEIVKGQSHRSTV